MAGVDGFPGACYCLGMSVTVDLPREKNGSAGRIRIWIPTRRRRLRWSFSAKASSTIFSFRVFWEWIGMRPMQC